MASLMERVPGRFSTELGLRLQKRRGQDLFLWFLAAILFGARISGSIAVHTHAEFVRRGLTSPERILKMGWDGLVDVLDAGGYVRYDYKTATKLLEVMRTVIGRYEGDLNNIHRAARDSEDLSERLKSLGKGIGDVTVEIFLRELRGVWPKARPPLSSLAVLAVNHLKLEVSPSKRRAVGRLGSLRQVWREAGPAGHCFADFESALVRLGRDYCRQQRRDTCPMREFGCGVRRRRGRHAASDHCEG
ncbi:MAG: hypothetical protein HZB35_02745 [Nitrospirae bacterium]|nr:hypothetical protein [Nitrospirota bacterium]